MRAVLGGLRERLVCVRIVLQVSDCRGQRAQRRPCEKHAQTVMPTINPTTLTTSPVRTCAAHPIPPSVPFIRWRSRRTHRPVLPLPPHSADPSFLPVAHSLLPLLVLDACSSSLHPHTRAGRHPVQRLTLDVPSRAIVKLGVDVGGRGRRRVGEGVDEGEGRRRRVLRRVARELSETSSSSQSRKGWRESNGEERTELPAWLACCASRASSSRWASSVAGFSAATRPA